MKEFEKDEILEEEEALSAEAGETEEGSEAQAENEESEKGLMEELEEIRDMFQEELDRAALIEEEIIIQELEDVSFEETDEEEIPEEELCECCGENPCSKEYGEGYPYCDECRENMKRYPLRPGAFIMLIVMAAVFAGSLYLSYPYMNDAISVADASAYYQSGYTMSALKSYYTYFNGGKTGEAISKRAFDEMIDGYIKLGYQTDASTLIQTYYDDEALNKPWNKKYKAVVDEAALLAETYEAVNEVTYDALYGKDFDYDEVMAGLDALREDSTAEYNDVFVEYYRYIVMSVSGKTPEEQLEQLRAIDVIGEGYEWVYLANYCAVAAKCGDEEAVNSTFDRLTENNIQEINAYIAKADYYRFLDKPDADKMIEICNEAEKVADSTDLGYKHSLTIAYLLKGEGALALEEIEAIFNSGAYNVQNCNLYALCGLYTGDMEKYDEMAALLAGYGYEISDLVTQYREGEITIEEVLTDKGGDI